LLRTFFSTDKSEEELSLSHKEGQERRSAFIADFRSLEYPTIELRENSVNRYDVDYQRLSIAQKTLGSNWCTLSLLRECQFEFLKFVVRRTWLDAGVTMMAQDEARLLELLHREDMPKHTHRRKFSDYDNGSNIWDLEIEGYHPQEDVLLILKVRYQSGLIQIHRVEHGFRNEGSNLLEYFRFPDLGETCCGLTLPLKVFKGPWTEEKGILLQLLRNSE